ncbi:hypothetical protein EBZ38_06415 [bacterium]|nr:hypothetical protein [bacterium]
MVYIVLQIMLLLSRKGHIPKNLLDNESSVQYNVYMKRDLIKYVRDAAKSAYIKGTECIICGTKEGLDLHHFVGLTELFNLWCRKNNKRINTLEDILLIREEFIAAHHKELYEDVVTLCKKHHEHLHAVFGKAPVITSAAAQRKWVNVNMDKNSRSTGATAKT